MRHRPLENHVADIIEKVVGIHVAQLSVLVRLVCLGGMLNKHEAPVRASRLQFATFFASSLSGIRISLKIKGSRLPLSLGDRKAPPPEAPALAKFQKLYLPDKLIRFKKNRCAARPRGTDCPLRVAMLKNYTILYFLPFLSDRILSMHSLLQFHAGICNAPTF